MQDVLAYAADIYRFPMNTLSFITESTNKVYEFERKNKRYILRIAQKPHECIANTKAEIDWLYYLAENGINVSLPLFTHSSELVASMVDDNGYNYILSAYEKANGVFWDKNDPMRWNTDIFHSWGSVMGDIHRLTKDYVPSDAECTRSTFRGNDALANSYSSNLDVKAVADEVIQQIMRLPRDRESFGLIHYDFHPWNFYIDGRDIRVFDFDDCLYGWFAMDIGIALYHGLWWGRPPRPDAAQEFSKEFIKSFLKGYTEHNHLYPFWLTKIRLFMRYRQICKFSWFYRPQDINTEQMQRIKNIKNDVLFDDCDADPSYFVV